MHTSTQSTEGKKLNLSFRRFEFKYLLDKSVADRILPQLLNYMEYDAYVGDKDYYECHSLYMDSVHKKCYHEKIDGILNRKKVRVRSYSRKFSDTDPLFYEIKRKSGDIVLKDRFVLPGKTLKLFYENPFSFLSAKRQGEEDVMEEFLYEYSNYSMRPTALVSYKRRPFFSKFQKSFRVTFDYDLDVAKADGVNYDTEYTRVYGDKVVMEVKFNGNMPRWFHDIIEMYSLTKISFCKYCEAIDATYGIPNFT